MGDSEKDKEPLHKVILHVLAGLTEFIPRAKLDNGVDDTFQIPYNSKLIAIERERVRLEKQVGHYE